MSLRILLCFAILMSACFAHEFHLRNNCGYTIWPGILGTTKPTEPIVMKAKSNHNFVVPNHWSGRIWGRTDCTVTGTNIQCHGGGADQPATLAEFTFDGAGNQDFYDVSLVDGYNLQMQIIPVAGTFKKGAGNNHYDCGIAGCTKDLNAICPTELQVKKDGKVVVCLSACAKFKTDEYCCGGAHNTPQTCKSTDWAKNYPSIFKTACPEAYSYAYDDAKSTFVCHGNPTTSYEIVFCP